MLMVAANVWGQENVDVVLSVIDTKGNDTIFNGKTDADGERLSISVSVTDNNDELTLYYYTLTVGGITIGAARTEIEDNGEKIVQSNWDGMDLPSDGTYTMQVEIFDNLDVSLDTDEESFTFDRTPPEISIGVDATEFSPNRDRVLDRINVFYSIE